MNKMQTKKQIPPKALKLLPWYATGWLSPKEREYVQEILSQYPAFQEMLEQEHQIIKTLKDDKSILDQSCLEDTEVRLNKVLNNLPQTSNNKSPSKTSNTENQDKKNLLAYFSALFSNDSAKMQYAVFAVMTMVSIGLLFAFISPLVEEKTVFYPAASSVAKSNNSTTTLLIGLNTEPNHPRLLKILKEYNATLETIPGKSGMHHLSLSVKLNAEQTKNLLKKLTNDKELFWFAGEEF